MAFQINAELHYEVLMRSTVLLSIHALATQHQKLRQESFKVTPGVVWEEMPVGTTGENRYIRLDTGNAPSAARSTPCPRAPAAARA